MLFKLLGKIIDRHCHITDTDRCKCFDIVVDNGTVTYLEQRLWGGKRERTQPLTFASSHKYCPDRKNGASNMGVDYAYHTVVSIEHRDKTKPTDTHITQ